MINHSFQLVFLRFAAIHRRPWSHQAPASLCHCSLEYPHPGFWKKSNLQWHKLTNFTWTSKFNPLLSRWRNSDHFPLNNIFFRGSPLDPLCPASSLLLLHPRPQSAGVTRTWNRKVIRCWRRTQEFRILEQSPTSVIWYIAMDNHHIRCSYRYISTDCGESSAMLRIWQTFTEFVEYTLW